MSLTGLPAELLDQILNYLDPQPYLRATEVSSRLYRL